MPRFATHAGSMIACFLLRLMCGTGYSVQKLMAVRAGAYGRIPSASDAAGSDRAIATALGAAAWTLLLVFASIALV